MCMSHLDNRLHRIDGPQHIADMRHTDDLGAIRNQRFQLIYKKDSIIRNGQVLHNNPPFHRLQLP